MTQFVAQLKQVEEEESLKRLVDRALEVVNLDAFLQSLAKEQPQEVPDGDDRTKEATLALK